MSSNRHTGANRPNTWLIIYGRLRALPQLDTSVGSPCILPFTVRRGHACSRRTASMIKKEKRGGGGGGVLSPGAEEMKIRYAEQRRDI